MTHDEMIAVIQAAKEGKEIEWQVRGKVDWYGEAQGFDFDFSEYNYRIEPEPTLRAWTMEDVPLNCWIRYKGKTIRHFVVNVYEVFIEVANSDSSITYDALLHMFEYTTDGVTWLPCGVKE